MTQTIEKSLQLTKLASKEIALLRSKVIQNLLREIAGCLQKNKSKIMQANERDITHAQNEGFTQAFLDRLNMSENVFNGMITQLETVAKMSDIRGEIIEQKELNNHVLLQKKRFPIGVIAMIYESRPHVTVDAAALCIKAGNAIVLKGGSEALQTNKALIAGIHQVLQDFNITTHAVALLDVNHREVEKILRRNDLIDLVIPRGSFHLTTTVAEKSRIPVLYHAAGGACMYVDRSANLDLAVNVCVNAKTNKYGVCNALDLVIVHASIAKSFLETLDRLLENKGCEVRGDQRAHMLMIHSKRAVSKDFYTEFLDTILAVKVVASSEEAIRFIAARTHGHTEVIIAENNNTIQRFIDEVDAAGIMVNCSSRLHDGGEFGMGAEMGIATGKIHARGPVGIKELTTYKWIAYGEGQTKK